MANIPSLNAPLIGTWLSIGSPVITELAGECGFDWVLVDLEHGCATEAAVIDQLRALKGTATRAIVRVGAPHVDLIARVLDWGAQGIMVPHVNSAAEAEVIVQAAHYAPRGKRGYSRTVRTYGYGLRPPADSPAPPLILAQIETVEGVTRAAEIAAVEGIDTLFVGPADLTYDLKHRAPERDYEACLDAVNEAAAQHGKSTGILIRKPADLAAMKARGFTWLAIDSDLSLLREGYLRMVKESR